MAVRAQAGVTLYDITDGYSIILTSEAYSFIGGAGGAASGSKCSTQAVAFCGSVQCNTVNIDADAIVCPDGISAAVTNNGTASPTITFTTTKTLTEACETTIPVEVDEVVINKKFSFAVAKAGSDGTSVTIKSKSVTYQVGTSGTAAPTGTWSTTVPTVGKGKYLWTKTVVEYSDGNKTEAFAVSYNGTNGTDADPLTITSKTITYQVGSSGTTPPTGTWSAEIPSVGQGKYLWTKTYVKYSDGNETTSYAVAYNAIDGQNGADAITLSYDASNGTAFKNNTGSTVLTAHVFLGGVEQDITDAGVCGELGSIKWYKGTTLVTTAKLLTVKASDVDSVQAYSCKLED